jgi:hypothetical protein
VTHHPVQVTRLATRDCDVVLAGQAAMTAVDSSTFSNALGGATLELTGAEGVMQVGNQEFVITRCCKRTLASQITNSTSDIFVLVGDSGSALVSNVTVSSQLKVATQARIHPCLWSSG